MPAKRPTQPTCAHRSAQTSTIDFLQIGCCLERHTLEPINTSHWLCYPKNKGLKAFRIVEFRVHKERAKKIEHVASYMFLSKQYDPK